MTDRHHHEVLSALRQPTVSLRQARPDPWSGFTALHEAAMTDGTIPRRIKELIAMAIGVIDECDGCIAYHARAAARAGATPAEAAEVLGVALLMGGGPSSVWAPRAWEAFHEFLADSVRPAPPSAATG